MSILSKCWRLLNGDLTGSSPSREIQHPALGKCVFFKGSGSGSYLEAAALCPPQAVETVFTFDCDASGPDDAQLGPYEKCTSHIDELKAEIGKQVDITSEFSVVLIDVPKGGGLATEYRLEVEASDGSNHSIVCRNGSYAAQTG